MIYRNTIPLMANGEEDSEMLFEKASRRNGGGKKKREGAPSLFLAGILTHTAESGRISGVATTSSSAVRGLSMKGDSV